MTPNQLRQMLKSCYSNTVGSLKYTLLHPTASLLNMNGQIFQNLVFISFEELSLYSCKFKISDETVKQFGCKEQFCILQLPIFYRVA